MWSVQRDVGGLHCGVVRIHYQIVALHCDVVGLLYGAIKNGMGNKSAHPTFMAILEKMCGLGNGRQAGMAEVP